MIKLSEKEYRCSAVTTADGNYLSTISATSKSEAKQLFLEELQNCKLIAEENSIEIEEFNYNPF